jgi:DNA processing protein
VFAVPGSIKEEACRGSNRLIKEGAKLIEGAQDILDEILPQVDARQRAALHLDRTLTEEGVPLRKEETLVYEALSYEAQSIDMVIERTGLSVAEVSAALLSLELNRRIRQLPGQHYIRL